jgi:hypothetical protein
MPAWQHGILAPVGPRRRFMDVVVCGSMCTVLHLYVADVKSSATLAISVIKATIFINGYMNGAEVRAVATTVLTSSKNALAERNW